MSSSQSSTNVDAVCFSSSSDSMEPINRNIAPLIQWLNNNCNVTDDGHPVRHMTPTAVAQNMDILDRHRYQYQSSIGTVTDSNNVPILKNSVVGALSYTHGNLEDISTQPCTSQQELALRNNISPSKVLTVTGILGCNGHVEVKSDDHQAIGISDGDNSNASTLPLRTPGSFKTEGHIEERSDDQKTVGLSEGDNSSPPSITLRTQGSFKTKKYTTGKVNNNRSSTMPQKITNRRVHVSTSSYNNSSSSNSDVVEKSKISKIHQARSRMRFRSRVESTSSDSSDTDDDDGEETSSDLSLQGTNSSEPENAAISRKNGNNAQKTRGKKTVDANRRKTIIGGHHFRKAIGLTLRKINRQNSITHSSMQIANDFVNDMFVRISSEASNLMRLSRRNKMTARDIQFAVKLVLPKNLAVCADMVGKQALLKYANSK